MVKADHGAVVRTALFFLLAIALIMPGCKDSGRKAVKPADEAATAAAPDSSSILSLDKMIRENPKNPALFAKRAEQYAIRKNYDQALGDITIALSLDSLNPGYFISQAEYYIFTGEPNSAKKALNLSIRDYPENTDLKLKLAEIHLYLKEYGQAKLVLKEVMPINDDLAQIYFIQGVIALETKDTTGAIKNFQVCIEKEPEYYAAYIQAGKIYSNQGNPLAIQYLKSAIDLQPKMYEAHYLLAYFYQEHSQLDEANAEYEFISSKIDSTHPDPYYNRGFIQMVYKADYEEAVKWFSKAIFWSPKYADAWYNRGFSYELSGQFSKARADYEKAMEIEPNFPLALKGLNRIEDGKPIKTR
jgi:tetratricopeptide (TPR) repeat protein